MLKELEQVKKLSNTVQDVIDSMRYCLTEAVVKNCRPKPESNTNIINGISAEQF